MVVLCPILVVKVVRNGWSYVFRTLGGGEGRNLLMSCRFGYGDLPLI
jgi:hypothetical protein